jgi:hypothetical protein
VVSYDRGYRNLRDKFDVFETEGLSITSTDNRVSKIKTFTENFQKLPRGHKKLQELRTEIFKNLNQYAAADNSAIQSKIDELLADDCALARQYHRQRQAGFDETWVSTM